MGPTCPSYHNVFPAVQFCVNVSFVLMFLSGTLRSIRVSPSPLQLPPSLLYFGIQRLFSFVSTVFLPTYHCRARKMSSGSLCPLHFILHHASTPLISLSFPPASAPKHPPESTLLSTYVVTQPIPPSQCLSEVVFLRPR